MPSFVHPLLLWGLPAVLLPVVIHLINMLRHRRVRWAAMEFLLVSHKKNRTWVLLKDMLLLALRMAVVAVLVLAVAKPRLPANWTDWLAKTTTHHIILLDDSYSMSDRWGDTDAMARAKAVVARIGEMASRAIQAQRFTLLRFSRVGQTVLGTQPDLFQEAVGPDFGQRLHEVLNPISASQTAAGPAPALEAIGQLMGDGAAEHRIVYLVSDFRTRQWQDARQLRQHLQELQQSGARIRLIQCVDQARPNLAITELVPGDDTRAAGVPLSMEVAVQNFGLAPVKDVPVLILVDGQPLPGGATIAEIPPGRVAKTRLAVQFAKAGQHRIEARLELDAVAADNARYAVIDIPPAVPVLIIDDDPESRGAWYLSAALAPGGPVPSGISPRIEAPRYLSLNPLEGYQAVYLLNIGRLESSAIDALERYVASGHGLAVFLGDRCQPKFVNDELYRGGKGFFPVPVANQEDLPLDRLEQAPDLEVGRHPVFQVLAGSRNPFISTVNVSRYIALAKDWQKQGGPRVEVLARLRNGAPLAVERSFGEGRVVVFLSTLAPVWNNWARGNPSFVVAMQRLQAYLAWRPKADVSLRVGEPLELRLDPARYAPQIRFTTPVESKTPTPSVEASSLSGGPLVASLAATGNAGFYEATLHRTDGTKEVRTWAYNVEPDEGDLRMFDIPQLSSVLEGIRVEFARAEEFSYAAEEQEPGGHLGHMLILILVFLLIAEQILAWSASYHPAARQRTLAQGGAA